MKCEAHLDKLVATVVRLNNLRSWLLAVGFQKHIVSLDTHSSICNHHVRVV